MKSDFFSVSFHSFNSLGVDWPEGSCDRREKEEEKEREETARDRDIWEHGRDVRRNEYEE